MFFENRHTCCVIDGIWEKLNLRDNSEDQQLLNRSNFTIEFYHRGTINKTGKRCGGERWKNYRRYSEKRYVNYNKLSEIIYLSFTLLISLIALACMSYF